MAEKNEINAILNSVEVVVEVGVELGNIKIASFTFLASAKNILVST